MGIIGFDNIGRRLGDLITPFGGKKEPAEFRESKIHLEVLYQGCVEHIRPVTCPLVLISQVQRSGGTLLSQLLDGHPELHAHPHELKIGYPTKYTWPRIDLGANLLNPSNSKRFLFAQMVEIEREKHRHAFFLSCSPS